MRKFGGCWGVVGGSIEKTDKDSRAAAIRETQEETGIEIPYVIQTKMQQYKNKDLRSKSTLIIHYSSFIIHFPFPPVGVYTINSCM